MSDGLSTAVELVVQFEYPGFEIVGVLCIGVTTRRLQRWYLASVVVFFDKLLHPSSTDSELFSDQSRVHVVVDNTLTYSGNIVLVKRHFVRSVGGEIMPTKSLAYTTVNHFVDCWLRMDALM